jgi:hypothetical protein
MAPSNCFYRNKVNTVIPDNLQNIMLVCFARTKCIYEHNLICRVGPTNVTHKFSFVHVYTYIMTGVGQNLVLVLYGNFG